MEQKQAENKQENDVRYGSVCSGVEAASLAWGRLGWTPVFFSEVDPFPCAVLKERFPDVPNLGDMTKIKACNNGDIQYDGADGLLRGAWIDLLVGGTPCQSYSVAGKRKGNRGVSGLSLDYIRLAYSTHARWVVWENVPGCLSSTGGDDFAAFLSGLSGWDVPVPAGGWRNAGICRNAPGGYGLAWRVLDAQYTRVPGFPRAIPQRRRRVFLVGYRGRPLGDPMDWTHPAAVLFEQEGLRGNPPPRGKAGEETPGDTGDRAEKAGRGDGGDGKRGVTNSNGGDVMPTLSSDLAHLTSHQQECRGGGICWSVGNGQVNEAQVNLKECSQTLNCMHDQQRILIENEDDLHSRGEE